MEPLDFGGAKQCQTIALLMGVAHPQTEAESEVLCNTAWLSLQL